MTQQDYSDSIKKENKQNIILTILIRSSNKFNLYSTNIGKDTVRKRLSIFEDIQILQNHTGINTHYVTIISIINYRT